MQSQPTPPQSSLLTLDGLTTTNTNETTLASTTNQFDTDQETGAPTNPQTGTKNRRGNNNNNNNTTITSSLSNNLNGGGAKSRRFAANSTERGNATSTASSVTESSSSSSSSSSGAGGTGGSTTRNSSSTRSGKKTIDKSDISCPFRCSCVDLSGAGVEPPSESTSSLTPLITQQKTANNTTEMIKKYSTVVKELASSQMLVQPSEQLDENAATAREILKKRSVGLVSNRRLVQVVADYINGYGGVRKFELAQERSEHERNKFNAFLASSIAVVSASSQQTTTASSTTMRGVTNTMSKSTLDLTSTTSVGQHRARIDSVRKLDDGKTQI